MHSIVVTLSQQLPVPVWIRSLEQPHQHRTLRPQPSLNMSKITPAASSSSSNNLQAIFEASLKEYEKKTAIGLVTHPLMAQLQACDSPAKILKLLWSQAAKVEETLDADDKLIKWLDPVVNVLSASSSVISASVGLVNTFQMIFLRSND